MDPPAPFPASSPVPTLTDAESAAEWREMLVSILYLTEYHNTLSEYQEPEGWTWSKIQFANVSWDQQQQWALGIVIPSIDGRHLGHLGKGETIAAAWERLNHMFPPTQSEIVEYFRLPKLAAGFDEEKAQQHLAVFEQRFILLQACGMGLHDDAKVSHSRAALRR